MATESEKKDQQKSWEHKRNFGLIAALSAAGLLIPSLVGPALMLPGVLITGYFQGKIEANKHGESWRARLSKTIFHRKSHGGSHGHGDHGGGHGGH